MNPMVIGIAGASGSGKTTLVHHIIESLPEGTALHFQHDAYYRDLDDMPESDPAKINYDHPSSLETALCAEQLQSLKRGESVEQPIYDFSTHRRMQETLRLDPKAVIIVEGILVLADELLRREMDLKIFVDTDPDICLLRRIERDMSERGRSLQSVRDQYYATVKPMFEEFVETSKKYSDLIVPYNAQNSMAEQVIICFIRHALSVTSDQ